MFFDFFCDQNNLGFLAGGKIADMQVNAFAAKDY